MYASSITATYLVVVVRFELTRLSARILSPLCIPVPPYNHIWWEELDLNQRNFLGWRIYSPLQLPLCDLPKIGSPDQIWTGNLRSDSAMR